MPDPNNAKLRANRLSWLPAIVTLLAENVTTRDKTATTFDLESLVIIRRVKPDDYHLRQ
jgi:hypothetical protein